MSGGGIVDGLGLSKIIGSVLLSINVSENDAGHILLRLSQHGTSLW